MLSCTKKQICINIVYVGLNAYESLTWCMESKHPMSTKNFISALLNTNHIKFESCHYVLNLDCTISTLIKPLNFNYCNSGSVIGKMFSTFKILTFKELKNLDDTGVVKI